MWSMWLIKISACSNASSGSIESDGSSQLLSELAKTGCRVISTEAISVIRCQGMRSLRVSALFRSTLSVLIAVPSGMVPNIP